MQNYPACKDLRSTAYLLVITSFLQCSTFASIEYGKIVKLSESPNDSHTKTLAGLEGGGGWGAVGPDSLNIHKSIGFLSNTGPDPLKKTQGYRASIQ